MIRFKYIGLKGSPDEQEKLFNEWYQPIKDKIKIVSTAIRWWGESIDSWLLVIFDDDVPQGE